MTQPPAFASLDPSTPADPLQPDLFDSWPAPMAAVTPPQPVPGTPQPFPQSPPEYPDNVPPEIEEPEVPGENQPIRDPQGPPPDIIALH